MTDAGVAAQHLRPRSEGPRYGELVPADPPQNGEPGSPAGGLQGTALIRELRRIQQRRENSHRGVGQPPQRDRSRAQEVRLLEDKRVLQDGTRKDSALNRLSSGTTQPPRLAGAGANRPGTAPGKPVPSGELAFRPGREPATKEPRPLGKATPNAELAFRPGREGAGNREPVRKQARPAPVLGKALARGESPPRSGRESPSDNPRPKPAPARAPGPPVMRRRARAASQEADIKRLTDTCLEHLKFGYRFVVKGESSSSAPVGQGAE